MERGAQLGGQGLMWGGGGDGCHLRVVPPGQLLRRPSTPKRFCFSAIFIQPGFYFLCREVSFSCVFCLCFPVVHIHIYIFFIYFFIVQWVL